MHAGEYVARSPNKVREALKQRRIPTNEKRQPCPSATGLTHSGTREQREPLDDYTIPVCLFVGDCSRPSSAGWSCHKPFGAAWLAAFFASPSSQRGCVSTLQWTALPETVDHEAARNDR
ncbi:hypothetical protein SMMN14_02457 [Sphaerulina musiva]